MKRRTRKTSPLPKGCDSKLEADLKAGGLKGCSWKPEKIPYTIHREYHPDCQYGTTIIEVKGMFRDSAEAAKYLWIREELDDPWELVFVFANPNAKLPYARRRKDGSKMTIGEWATKHDFTWYDQRHLPREWGKK